MNRRQFCQTSAAELLFVTLQPFNAFAAPPALNPSVATSGEKTLYIATNGSDKNPGSKDRPLASIAAARRLVREMKKHSRGPITVYLRKGTYYLSETMVFESTDSGTPDQPITYAAFPGELVTLSGGQRLRCNWKTGAKGIGRTSLDRDALGFTQLFVNGKRQIRARYPKYDAQNPFRCKIPIPCQGETNGYVKMADKKTDWPATKAYFNPATFTKKRWKNPRGAVMHAFPETYIGNLQWEVESVDWANGAISLGRGGYQINDLEFKRECTGIGPQSIFFVENVLEELEDPGEWFLDNDEAVLHYKPRKPEELSSGLFESAHLKHLVEIRGSQDEPVTNLRFSGFRIAHTASTFLEEYEAPSHGDWTIYRGGAFVLDGTEDCSVENCFFDAIGGNGVFVSNYNLRARVYGNKFTDAGESAVCLVGTKNRNIGSNRPLPVECVVSNNLVHDCGVFGKQTAAVFASTSEHATISHNVVYNMPRSAICINDGWGGGHVIEFNEIHDVVLETQDHGSINSWGRETFWCMQQSHPHQMPGISHTAGDVKQDCRYTNIVRNNYIHETVHNEWALDFDDGTSNYHAYNNLCVGVGITHREGDFRTIENNIIIHPKNPPGPKVSYENNNDRYVRNILVTSKQDGPTRVGNKPGDMYSVILPPLHSPCAAEIDYNLFFSSSGDAFESTVIYRQPPGPAYYDWEKWHALGFDKSSLFSDPMFVDLANGDYRLKPESPAFKLGFKPFDLRKVGLREDFPAHWLEGEQLTKPPRTV